MTLSNQFELKDVGTVLGFGASLNGGVLVAHEGIVVVVVVEVSHGIAQMRECGVMRGYKKPNQGDECM